MSRFLSDTLFKSFSSKYVYVEAAKLQHSSSSILLPLLLTILYNVHTCSHTPTCMWSAALINAFSCTHAFLLWGGPNTHPLNLFHYSLFKNCIILLQCQFSNNDNSFLTRPGSVITHRVWGGGGGWWWLVTQNTTSRWSWQNVNSKSRLLKIQNVQEGKRHQKKRLMFLGRSFQQLNFECCRQKLLAGK